MHDFRKEYRWRALSSGGKPLDFGAGGINGSIDSHGRITAINAYHPVHGYVTLTAATSFPEDQRYNPQAVRAYRAALANVTGFGLHFAIPIVKHEAWLIEDVIPCVRLTLENGVTAEAITFVPEEKPVGIMQWWRFSEAGRSAYFAGQFSLQRCAYTQLTEGGPLPMPAVQANIFYQRMGAVGIENPALGWAVFMHGSGVVAHDDGTVEFAQTEPVYPIQPGATTTLLFGLGLNQSEATTHLMMLREMSPEWMLANTLDVWRKRWRGWQYDDHPLDLALRRGLVYGLNCCIPVNDQAACLITDHQLLPLSWNRDAYYVAMALLRWHEQMAEVVRRHLLWTFEIAERPDGIWGRSYLANGKIKDRAFQLDQQLFPLLELVEYVEATGDTATWDRLSPLVTEVIRLVRSREHAGEGLFATDETPADDPVVLPYHLSSHILLWHTFRNLAAVMHERELSAIADRTYDAIWREFVVEHNGRKLLAYLTDGAGSHHIYHDANDLPLAIAPFLGFCRADDPIWRSTMAFAFSPENVGGYYPGQYGGLGSVHTPDSWALGDVQTYIVAKLTGDRAAEQMCIERFQRVAQPDGALPEAYSADTGQVVSRHWFSWPGAALALYCNLLQARTL